MVLPWLRSSASFSLHLRWKASSPTARTSSISSTSGSTLIATAERQSHVHAGRIVLYRLVDERPDAGEVDNFIEASSELLLRKAQDRPVEEDVFPPRQLRVESRTELEQGRHLAGHRDQALVGPENPGHALEHGALARAVLSDQAEGLTLVDLKRHVSEGPEVLSDDPPAAHDGALERVVALLEQAELLGDPDDLDCERTLDHNSSARPASSRLNTSRPATNIPIAQAVK